MAILLHAAVFLLPLLILPGILFHYDITPKILVLCFTVAACLMLPRQIAVCISALWKKPNGRWLCILAAAQVLWYAGATSLSSRPWFSLFGSNWRRFGLLTVAALCLFTVLAAGHFAKEPAALRTALRASAAAVTISSVYGILQYFDIDPLQNPLSYHSQAGYSTIVRPPGTLGHADYFGWWLAVALFCAVALARIETGWWKRAALGASVLSGIAIILSGTRAAMLAVVAGFLGLAVLSGWKPRHSHAYGALACAAVFLAFLFSPSGTRLRARVHWSGNEPLGGARPLLWRDSLRMFAARPVIGFGPETFSAEFPRYQSVELARLFPDFYHESPHNTALDALTSEGIPGLLLAVGWGAIGWRSRNPAHPALTAALLASCVASLFSAVTAGPVFVTLLVIAALVASSPDEATARGSVRPVVAFAISVPLGLGLAFFAAWLAMADYRLARFQNSDADPSRAILLYASSIHAALPGAGEDLYCSRLLATLCGAGANPVIQAACAETTLRAAARATTTADNPPNAWYNLAGFWAMQNNAAKVEFALHAASSQAPNWFKPHWAIANVLALAGRDAEARAEATRAFQLDSGKDPEVRETFVKLTQPSR